MQNQTKTNQFFYYENRGANFSIETRYVFRALSNT